MSRSAPWMKFYPADWRSDPTLRAVSLCARGLWIECIALMHEADPYGFLCLNGKPMTPAVLAKQAGCGVEEVERLLSELEEAGVFSRNKAGTIYSRRMVRDEKLQRISRENGKKGGNPSLCKQTEILQGDNPTLKARYQKPDTREEEREERESYGLVQEPPPEPVAQEPADEPVAAPEEKVAAVAAVADATCDKGGRGSAGSQGKNDGVTQETIDGALDDWTVICDLNPAIPNIRDLNDKRRKALRAILAKHGQEGWQDALRQVHASDFLSGRMPPRSGKHSAWRCTFDWITAPANFLKVIEGTYADNKAVHRLPPPASGMYAQYY
jgi:hypothetical protein